MDDVNRRFTSAEVSAIVRRALVRQVDSEGISYEELEDIARQSGISVADLHQAIAEEAAVGKRESAKAMWLTQRKSSFFRHLRVYCIVNGCLFFINVMTAPDGYRWVVWPILGWGIGLALHASSTFFPSEQKAERGARRILRRHHRHQGNIGS
jgi:predicted DNA-binding ribbon-helix-helix protein